MTCAAAAEVAKLNKPVSAHEEVVHLQIPGEGVRFVQPVRRGKSEKKLLVWVGGVAVSRCTSPPLRISFVLSTMFSFQKLANQQRTDEDAEHKHEQLAIYSLGILILSFYATFGKTLPAKTFTPCTTTTDASCLTNNYCLKSLRN